MRLQRVRFRSHPCPSSSPLIGTKVVGIDSLKAMDSLTEDLAGDQLLGVRTMNVPAMLLYVG